MLEEIIDWAETINIIAKKTGQSKREICRQAGIDGSVMQGAISVTKKREPRHSEGEFIIKLFKKATHGDAPPMALRKAMVTCLSCQSSKPIALMYRVSENAARCGDCIKRIERASRAKCNEERRNGRC
jgi:hypothetical protein